MDKGVRHKIRKLPFKNLDKMTREKLFREEG